MNSPMIALAVLCLTTSACAAEDCALKRTASLEITTLPNGDMSVPATIAGSDRRFVLDMGHAFSYVLGSYADANNLKTSPMPENVSIGLTNGKVAGRVTVPEFRIGAVHGTDLEFLRLEGWDFGASDVVGIVGLNLLSNMDVEIDFKANRLNLYSQDHCKGNVVYWANDYAEVPFKTDPTGHMIFEMELDGKSLVVYFDTSRSHAFMTTTAAQKLFALDPTSPGMGLIAGKTIDGNAVYRYSFKTLAVDGVAINNPMIDIVKDDTAAQCNSHWHLEQGRSSKCFGAFDMVLGMAELRALHLYFAFGEKELYVTTVDAHQ